jgi:hypothetical protein
MIYLTMFSFGFKQQSITQSWNKEEFEDSNGVIRIRKSKDRQQNGLKKKDERANSDLQNLPTHVYYRAKRPFP